MPDVTELKTTAVIRAARHVVAQRRTGTVSQWLDAIDLLAIRLEDLDTLAASEALRATTGEQGGRFHQLPHIASRTSKGCRT